MSIVVGFRDEPTGPMVSRRVGGHRVMAPAVRKSSGVPRAELWGWMRARWEALLPDAEICVGDNVGVFNRAAARNTAVGMASQPLLLIADTHSHTSQQKEPHSGVLQRVGG